LDISSLRLDGNHMSSVYASDEKEKERVTAVVPEEEGKRRRTPREGKIRGAGGAETERDGQRVAFEVLPKNIPVRK